MPEKNRVKYQTISVTIGLILILWSVLPVKGLSQKTVAPDTIGACRIRTSEQIHSYLNNPDFQYDKEPAVSPQSLLQRIWIWMMQIIAEFFYLLGKGGNLVAFIFYGLMLFLLIFIILKLMGLSPYRLIMKSKKLVVPDIPVYDKDIRGLNFDQIISEAVKAEDYRKAIRFLYIKFLKLLSDNEYIEWKREKTNKDYKREMKNNLFSKEFSHLTKIYEYVWYGEFLLKRDAFLSVHSRFDNVFKDF